MTMIHTVPPQPSLNTTPAKSRQVQAPSAPQGPGHTPSSTDQTAQTGSNVLQQQNLQPLIQPLIDQLDPDQSGKHKAGSRIRGTSGHDNLKGTQGNDRMYGRGGHDHLHGRAGDDHLHGGRGHDTLKGGTGNDRLYGGRGHDNLQGGAGNDRLYGGAGHDHFSDHSGQNRIDGGRGFDTLKLQHNVDDYRISAHKQGGFTLELRGEHQGEPTRHTVRNIESFQFRDGTLSAQALQQKVKMPPGGELPLSKTQKAAVEQVYNINNGSVQDKNGDGKISAGDRVSGTLFRETGTIDVSYKVSEDNARHINGEYGPDLKLSFQQLETVNQVVNPNALQLRAAGVLDQDGNGQLSEGDVVYSRPNLITPGGDPIGGSPSYHTLTAADLEKIQGTGQTVPLSGEQQTAIKDIFNIRGELNASVLDQDGNAQLSAGDTVVISGGITGGEISRFDLTDNQVSHINGEFGKQIPLSQEQITSLLGGPVPADFGFYGLDVDGSGSLSAGDQLVTFGTFTINGFVNPQYRTVTADDIQAINNPNAGLIPEISINDIQPGGQPVPFEKADGIRVGNAQLPAYLDKPSEQHIISNQAQLNQLRMDLGLPPAGLGGLPGTELPDVDFSQQVLVYSTRDAADPNQTRHSFTLNSDGVLSTQIASTKIGFQPSDETRFEFFVLPREGVEAFASNDPIANTQTDRALLETNKEKWAEAGLNQYRYTLQRSCFCGEEARLPVDNTFDNGALTSVFSDGRPGEVPEFNQLNVKDLFKIIDDAINRNADEIRVEYDPDLGHPTSIYIDFSQRIADEEVSLTISNLHAGPEA